ncbi:NepR family anti-sigma factor [Qipengyuania sp. ASV99]|uniref:NepR family anti-sigma factor n=1 Tax=Qipengyuania sp. ASV99 TaxID=3399681 RepID=UPI003A4C650B
MASSKKPDISDLRAGGAGAAPAWAVGLKQLYDTIVDEPIPDAFNDLLARLDQPTPCDDGGDASPRGGGKS